MPARRLTLGKKAERPEPKVVAETFGELEDYYVGEPLPAGEYHLRVGDEPTVEVGEQSGVPYVQAEIFVTEGPKAGRRFRERMSVATVKADGSESAALRMTRMKVRAILGTVPPSIGAISPKNGRAIAEAVAQEIAGKEFVGTVSISTDRTKQPDEPYYQTNQLGWPKPKAL